MYTGQSACSLCKSCSSNASTSGFQCSVASPNDTVRCVCNAGFYGDGENCMKCKICGPNSSTSGFCTGADLVDTVLCSCNAGYFGDGVSCRLCSACSPDATLISTCAGGNLYDSGTVPCWLVRLPITQHMCLTVRCACNAGSSGSGLLCSLCEAGNYSNSG